MSELALDRIRVVDKSQLVTLVGSFDEVMGEQVLNRLKEFLLFSYGGS